MEQPQGYIYMRDADNMKYMLAITPLFVEGTNQTSMCMLLNFESVFMNHMSFILKISIYMIQNNSV